MEALFAWLSIPETIMQHDGGLLGQALVQDNHIALLMPGAGSVRTVEIFSYRRTFLLPYWRIEPLSSSAA